MFTQKKSANNLTENPSKIKLSVLLFNTRGPFHWSCQHVAAVATDIATGRTFDINYTPDDSHDFYEVPHVSEGNTFKNQDCYVYGTIQKELFYINRDGKAQKVPITDKNKFERESKKFIEKKYLTSAEVKTLITDNGGHIPARPFTVYSNLGENPLGAFVGANSCCVGVTTLFSDKDFDFFVGAIKEGFSDPTQHNICSYNCADAVSFAINELCSEKTCTDVSFFIYGMLCCPLFFGTVGLSCFHSPPGLCTTPQDIYNKARWLANFTSYGKQVVPAEEYKNEKVMNINIS